MKKAAAARQGQVRQRKRRQGRIIAWGLALACVGLAGYGLSQMSNIAYDEDDIRVVNFSGLEAAQKRAALEAANSARCTCGCGMTLAQCVSTDMTCPIRDVNIETIRTLIRTSQGR